MHNMCIMKKIRLSMPTGRDPIEKLMDNSNRLSVNTQNSPWNRTELYDRIVAGVRIENPFIDTRL